MLSLEVFDGVDGVAGAAEFLFDGGDLELGVEGFGAESTHGDAMFVGCEGFAEGVVEAGDHPDLVDLAAA